MTALLLVLLLAPTADRELAAADALAARVRTLEGKAKDAALRQALEAYAAILKAHEKDRRLVPRVRRKRAKLLEQAERIEEALVEHDAIVEALKCVSMLEHVPQDSPDSNSSTRPLVLTLIDSMLRP